MLSRNFLSQFVRFGFLKAFILVIGISCYTFSFGQSDSIAIQKKEIILSGRTQGLMPFLKYGPGIDRLGGAKMTYLDTAIVLQIVDSLRNDYIVRLSRNHRAFIPKENVKLLSDIRKPDYYLTSSWNVSGDEKQDYVTIGLDERLPYQSIQLIDPSRIVVDIYGATGNTNWITQLKSAKEIKNVYHEQLEDDLFRVTIELKHAQLWGYSIKYKKNIDLSMTDRLLMLRETNPDLLISIHNNSASNPNVKGVSTYYRYIGFKPLSVAVLDRLLELGLNDFGNIGSFNFSLNGPTEYPNCLVEGAFLSNEADEKQIMDRSFQMKVAKKIRKGIIDWVRKAK
ncbi:MAG: N-acetylmuramoyl-L-alanine amidase [Bacteroidota bacterium]|nr:N-acetylmuramoyl-L-alanine amidase [Bacteroidota bacterium]